MAGKPRIKATTVDEYLAAVGEEQRSALENLRRAIRAAAPDAEECISYQVPAVRQGKLLVGFGATEKHCAFYLMSDATVAAHGSELARYDTSKGTIRFAASKPLPAALVKKLVKARLAENLAARPAGRAKQASRARAGKDVAGADAGVEEFLGRLEHPLKPQLVALRELILGVSPAIREGIKWNSPSFRTVDWFATINVHGRDGLRLILHAGAKVKASAAAGLKIADPKSLLQWLAKDRALVAIESGKDLEAKRTALKKIIRAWVGQV